MKGYLFSLLMVMVYTLTNAQGWRPGEQQVKIPITNHEQVLSLKELKIDFEPCASDTVRAYLVPKEHALLDSLGFDVITEIEDLNKHFENFWLSDDAYHSYQQIIDLADSLNEFYPSICKKYVLGTSVGGRQLAALKISDNVLIDEPEPEVFFDGGIHGDEIGGPENIIRFARDLCLGYGSNPTITDLIDNREIWLYLMVNPDGRANMVRENNNGVDLNRDCGYMWDEDGTTFGPFGETESKVLLQCNLDNQFVIYTSYHSGTEFLSYPWSYRQNPTADQAHMNQLAQVYVNQSGYSNLPYGQGYSGMYPINGSTKDAYYGITGSVSWSIEISMSKQPPASQIMTYYNYNKPSMLALIEYAGYGLQGTITDASTGEPVAAIIFVNNYIPCYSDPEVGDYHKYVLPGTYSITAEANGYQTQTINNVTVTANNAATANFQLQPESGQFAYKLISCRIPGNNFSDEGNTAAALGSPDNINYSIGKSGYCVLDMQYPVIDGPGPDLKVYEGDTSPESFTCYAGSTMNGPWISLGPGTGTSEFDLGDGGLSEARYIKILDDGDGTANAANAGFDLDAIEAMEQVSGVYLVMTGYTIDDSNGNNNGLIDPGETIDLTVTIKNNGDIPAENINGILSTVSPYVTISGATSDFGTLSQGEISTGTFTLSVDEATPAGQSFIAELNINGNNGSYTKTFIMSFSAGLIVEDWETGDFSQFDWQTGGNNNWMITTVNPYEGAYCVTSGDISDNQSSYLSITYNVLANGEISFFKKVSSESNYDFLSFYIDNNLQEHWSGEVAWSEASFPVTSGQHTFTWEYTKDVSVSGGSDCGWIDYIVLPSGATQGLLAFFIADQTQICEVETVSYTDYSSGNITSWNWSFPGGTPSTSNQQNPSVVYNSAGSYDVALVVSDGTNTDYIIKSGYIQVNDVPEIPDTPDGPVNVSSIPGLTNEYNTNLVNFATSYNWVADPPEAVESIVSNDNSCTIDWADYWSGSVNLSVQAVNDCGESLFSSGLTVYVVIENIKENSCSDGFIFPNPNNGSFSIRFSEIPSGKVNVRVINNVGKVVYEAINQAVNERNLDIRLKDTVPGIYLIEIMGEGILFENKILIR